MTDKFHWSSEQGQGDSEFLLVYVCLSGWEQAIPMQWNFVAFIYDYVHYYISDYGCIDTDFLLYISS